MWEDEEVVKDKIRVGFVFVFSLDRFSFFFGFWFGHDSVESFLNFF